MHMLRLYPKPSPNTLDHRCLFGIYSSRQLAGLVCILRKMMTKLSLCVRLPPNAAYGQSTFSHRSRFVLPLEG